MVEKLDGISPKPSEGLSEWDVTKSGAASSIRGGNATTASSNPAFSVSKVKTEKNASTCFCVVAPDCLAPRSKREKADGNQVLRLFSSKTAKRVLLIAVACVFLIYAVTLAVSFASKLEERELVASFESKLEEKEWMHVGSSAGDDVITSLDFNASMISFDVEIPSFNITDENVAVGSYRVLAPGTVEISISGAQKEFHISFEDDTMIVEPAITSSDSSEVWV